MKSQQLFFSLRFFLRMCLGFFLINTMTACHSIQTDQQDIKDIQSQNANVQMAQAASTISHSLTELGSLQRAVTPPLALRNLPDPDSYHMTSLASIDWSGPVEPIVLQIANASGYHLRILGNQPAVPILVSLHEKNISLGYILRNIDFQCATKANIIVLHHQKIIELRYARS